MQRLRIVVLDALIEEAHGWRASAQITCLTRFKDAIHDAVSAIGYPSAPSHGGWAQSDGPRLPKRVPTLPAFVLHASGVDFQVEVEGPKGGVGWRLVRAAAAFVVLQLASGQRGRSDEERATRREKKP